MPAKQELEFLRDLAENVNDLIQSVRPDGTFLYVNRAWCETLGYSREEAAQLSVFNVIHPSSRGYCEEIFQRVLAGESFDNVETTFIAKDGRAVPVEVSVNCRFQDGQPLATRTILRDVTERKQTEESLRRSQSRYYSKVQNLPVSLARKNAAGHFTFANEKFCALLGKPLDEVIGKTDFDFFPPELAEVFQQDDRRVIDSNVPLDQVEHHHALGDGMRHLQVLRIPIRDHQGRAIGVQIMSWDVTDRKEAEESLRQTNARLEAITRVQRQFLFEADPRQSFDQMLDLLLETTASEYGFIGEVLQSADGQPYLKTHAITNISWDEPTRAFFEQNAPAGLEFYNLKTLFGAVVTTGAPVIANDPAGDVRRGGLAPGHPALRAFLGLPFFSGVELIGMVGVANRPGGYNEGIIHTLAPILATCASLVHAFRSERQRKQAEEALHASEAFLRISQRVGKIGSWVWNLRTKRVRWSEAMYQIYGISPDQFDGTIEAVVRLTHSDDLPAMQASVERIIAHGDPEPIEYRIIKANQEIAYLWGIGETSYDQAGEAVEVIGVVIDITSRKRAEEERRRFEAQIQHAQKLESLGILAGGIAHDFNNLLTSILGYANLALPQLPQESPVWTMLQRIEQAGQRAAELTQQMLAYSGKGKSVIQVLRVDTVVQEMTKLLQTVVSKKAEFHLHLEPAAIEGDATQIRQVVMNLITNASDALEGKAGVIRVRTGVRDVVAADLRSPNFPDELPVGPYVFLEVVDNGCGMSVETLGRIFDPFFTTKFTGRGLGLAAVLGIVRGHRGVIKAVSTPGRGTAFEVLLPNSARAAVTIVPLAPRALPRGQGTVLLIEDEANVREFAEYVLESAGFRVLTAVDGREGLDRFAQYRQEIAAVLLDLTMPQLDGLEVLRQMRRQVAAVPILVMSGYSEHEVATLCVGTGASGYIQKPFRPHDFLARVCELMSSRMSNHNP